MTGADIEAAAIAAALGRSPGGADVASAERQRSRLKGRPRALPPAELVGLARGRAETNRYAGHASTAARLRAEVIDTTEAAANLALVETSAVDGYVGAGSLDELVTRHGLIRADLPQLGAGSLWGRPGAVGGPVLNACARPDPLSLRRCARL